MDYATLKTLIETHPDWPSVTDEALVVWANEEALSRDKTAVSNEEILAVILENRSEFTALSDTDKQIVRDILYVGDSVPTEAGTPARNALVSIFGGGSATITSLAEKISESVSRAVFAGLLGKVNLGDVQNARNF